MTIALSSSLLASRTNRLLGQILDSFVSMLPIVGGAILYSMSSSIGAVVMGGAALWSLFYYLFADGFQGGQSYAKRLLGMRVIDAKSGAPCSFGQSFVRNLLLSFLGPIDWIFIFGAEHQRLGDMVAGTIVVVDG